MKYQLRIKPHLAEPTNRTQAHCVCKCVCACTSTGRRAMKRAQTLTTTQSIWASNKTGIMGVRLLSEMECAAFDTSLQCATKTMFWQLANFESPAPRGMHARLCAQKVVLNLFFSCMVTEMIFSVHVNIFDIRRQKIFRTCGSLSSHCFNF